MTRPPNSLATHTSANTAQIWAAALSTGQVLMRLPSFKSVCNVRNKLHAYRAEQRRYAHRHTGFRTSCYDGLKITYREELDQSLQPTGYWLLSVGQSSFISFELLTPSTPGGVTNPNQETPMGGANNQPQVDETVPSAQPEAPDGQEEQSEVQESDEVGQGSQPGADD